MTTPATATVNQMESVALVPPPGDGQVGYRIFQILDEILKFKRTRWACRPSGSATMS